ncbi:hypothetical protein OLQ28_02370 [Campylobacter jejuni]|nr:hypothetical protein [Campylobacter jejuni]
MHLDYNANYRGRELLNDIFGEENFVNEIVWSYDKWTSSGLSFQKIMIIYCFLKRAI